MFRLYNTFTDAAIYERGFLKWDTNTFVIVNESAGTGSNRAVRIESAQSITFRANGANRWQMDTVGALVALADNSYDIGRSGSVRPRTLYLGTSIDLPAGSAALSSARIPPSGPRP